MILRPKPLALYWSLVCIGFWHVALFSQPQSSPPPLSAAFGTFLPVLFIAYAFWRLAFRFTLPAFSKAPIEAAVLYGGPFWVGVLTNLTMDKIPISRLTASDISKRSGAITALVIIIVIITIIVVNQIRVIRKTGWLPHYAGWYILGGLVALVLSQLPGLQLRLHHYILAMVLIPGTAWPTRLSAIYQGFLLGMFLNGAAAFGLDPILQTGQEVSARLIPCRAMLIYVLAATRRAIRVVVTDIFNNFCKLQRFDSLYRPSHHMGRTYRRLGRLCSIGR